MSYSTAMLVWVLFLLLAIPYVRRERHPSAKPLAAYLVFVAVFSLCAGALFYAATTVVAALALEDGVATPAGTAVFLAVVFVPAVLVARWQVRRPPERPPEP